MTMKRTGAAVAACLALALAFSACQNGVQEIEGDVGVGIKKAQMSAPAAYIEEMENFDLSQGLPPYVVIYWTAGPGFERSDTFKVFGQIGGKNTYFELAQGTSSTPPSDGAFSGTNGAIPTNDYVYTTANATTPKNTDIDKWYAKIDPSKLIEDMGLDITPTNDYDKYVELQGDIAQKGIRFGVQAIPGTTSTNSEKDPSGIAWTGSFPR
jgi:predicted small secreted protein